MALSRRNDDEKAQEAAQSLLDLRSQRPKESTRHPLPRKAKGYMEPDDTDDDDGGGFTAINGTVHSTNTGTQQLNTPDPIPHTHRTIHPCTQPGCSKTYLTTTGLRKHVNSAHEQTMLFDCPVEGCVFVQRPAKETVLRHLRGKHKMTDLPGWKKGLDKDEVLQEQARVFRRYAGHGADVTFFTADESAVEGKDVGGDEDGEDGAGEGEGEGDDDEADVVDDPGNTATETTPSHQAPQHHLAPDAFYGHTAALAKRLRTYADELRHEPETFELYDLITLLPADLPDHGRLKTYIESTPLLGNREQPGVGVKVAVAVRKWLDDFPMVDGNLCAWLIGEMRGMESVGLA